MRYILIADNIRSTHNIGSLFRSADCFGAEAIWLCGITPYPTHPTDYRLPHIAKKIHSQICKTSLGAEQYVKWQYFESTYQAINEAKKHGYHIVALEQSNESIALQDFMPQESCAYALVLGEEVHGLQKNILQNADTILEIPQNGKKESLNVSVAGAVAMYHFRTSGVRQ